MTDKVIIRRLATGVPGLDALLGGGLPEFSFNLIVGPTGSGKTTLAHQIMFALANDERKALFFGVLGEPQLKMFRYQQQYSFFDLDKIDKTIRFVNLSDDLANGSLGQVFAHMAQEVEAFSPSLVFVDSFRSVMMEAQEHPQGTISLRQFIERLGIHLSGWQATTFLIGEYPPNGDPHPVFTVADGILALDQTVYRNSMVRQIQALKMRGQPTRPGKHAFRIKSAGLEVFPAALVRDDTGSLHKSSESRRRSARVSMGVPGIDQMLGGGLPAGYSMLIAGPSGSGKTILATTFLAEGVRRGEFGVMVAFEQTPSQSRAAAIDDMVGAGQIGLINTRSLDLSVDEIVNRLIELIERTGATRVVIDSLSGFELAVAPSFREDFRESLFRMVAVLSGLNITVLLTSELEDRYTDLRFSPYGSAFLTDAIIVQRYVEIESRLKRVIAVVKVRDSFHSNELRLFDIDDTGLVIGDPVHDYDGLLGGRPTRGASHSVDSGKPSANRRVALTR
jgi:circadian clock protein KaiC